jgi:DNA-directed RNA polymerase subunit M
MSAPFCPVCGTKLKPTPTKDGVKLMCPRGHYETVGEVKPIVERTVKEGTVAVIEDVEEKITPMPTVRVECPKCGNNRAYWWLVQTRGGDESSTQFYKCTKCGYTWRLYS